MCVYLPRAWHVKKGKEKSPTGRRYLNLKLTHLENVYVWTVQGNKNPVPFQPSIGFLAVDEQTAWVCGISLRKIKWSHLYKDDAVHQQLQLRQETPVAQNEIQQTTTNLTSQPNSDISNYTDKPEGFPHNSSVHNEDDATIAKNQSDMSTLVMH